MSGRRACGRDKFWVGQRVIWKFYGREYTATVYEQREWRMSASLKRKRFVYLLEVDGYGKRGDHGMRFGAIEPDLRPLYDGDQPGSWEEVERLCGWTPERADLKKGACRA